MCLLSGKCVINGKYFYDLRILLVILIGFYRVGVSGWMGFEYYGDV